MNQLENKELIKIKLSTNDFNDAKLLELFNEVLIRIRKEKKSFILHSKLINQTHKMRQIGKDKKNYAIINLDKFDKNIWVWKKELLEKLEKVKKDIFYNWMLKQTENNERNFVELISFEKINCDCCFLPKERFKFRLWMLKTLFKIRIDNLKQNNQKELLNKKTLIQDYKEIVEQLEEDLTEDWNVDKTSEKVEESFDDKVLKDLNENEKN